MRLLLDQDVYALTARFVRDLGHDVVLAAEIGASRAPDTDILRLAQESGRILITRDRDFSRLAFLERQATGTTYLRVPLARLAEGHQELAVVLQTYGEDALRRAFVGVKAGRHRFRRLPAP